MTNDQGTRMNNEPPASTVRAPATSHTMRALARGDGETAGCSWIHVVPLHSHVSLRVAVPVSPPNNVARPRSGSNDSAYLERAGGNAAGAGSGVQLVPFHDQKPGSCASDTPTTWPRAMSKNAFSSRGCGWMPAVHC